MIITEKIISYLKFKDLKNGDEFLIENSDGELRAEGKKIGELYAICAIYDENGDGQIECVQVDDNCSVWFKKTTDGKIFGGQICGGIIKTSFIKEQ